LDKIMVLGTQKDILALFGQNDQNLRFMASLFSSIKLIPRGNELIISGEKENVENGCDAITYLLEIIKQGNNVQESDITHIFKKTLREKNHNGDYASYEIHTQRKTIKPKTAGQRDYIDAIKRNDIVFSIGPAGTGKTYLAMAMAVYYLFSRSVQRIILTRPVEKQEKI